MKKYLLVSLIAALSLSAGCGTPAASVSQAPSEAVPSAVEPIFSAESSAAPEIISSEEESETASIQDSSEVSDSLLDKPTMAVNTETFFQDYLDEPAASDVYAEVADQFELREYYDEESGLTIPYQFFTPEDTSAPLPMIMFIGDASCAGTDMNFSLSQGYGGTIWATKSEQAKRPCYVLVPIFPEIIIEDNVTPHYISDYVDATARMVKAVAAENNVDTNRLYTTGQSMGCMTSLYLAAHYPDLFAAELFVSGQWEMDELQGLETQTFFYIAAGGDPKASEGQSNAMADFDSKGVSYSVSYNWDATLSDADMEDILRAEIDEGNSRNFGQFAAGSVLEANNRGIEHMSSFDCAYKLDAVRAWLFAQTKE